jgi:hypothetical protein
MVSLRHDGGVVQLWEVFTGEASLYRDLKILAKERPAPTFYLPPTRHLPATNTPPIFDPDISRHTADGEFEWDDEYGQEEAVEAQLATETSIEEEVAE